MEHKSFEIPLELRFLDLCFSRTVARRKQKGVSHNAHTLDG